MVYNKSNIGEYEITYICVAELNQIALPTKTKTATAAESRRREEHEKVRRSNILFVPTDRDLLPQTLL
jgi:hypothetical protein